MSHTLPIEEAGAKLSQLVGMLKPGDEIVLTEQDRPVAKIVPSKPRHPRRQAGSCKGMLIIRQDDDEHSEGLRGIPAMRLLLDGRRP